MSTSTVLIVEVILALVQMWRSADDASKIKAEELQAKIKEIEERVAKAKTDYLPGKPE
jgi:hypothetical protein